MPRVDYLERYAELLPVLDAMSPAARAGVERLAEILQRDGVGVRTPMFATVAERDEAVSFLVQLADEAVDVEDPGSDLAILLLDPREGQERAFPSAPLGDSDALRQGEEVFARRIGR